MLNPAPALLAWNAPNSRFQVDPDPLRTSQFAGPDEDQRRKLQSDSCQRIAVIAINRAQQTARFLRLENRGQVLRLAAGQRAPKVSGWILSRDLVGDAVAVDLPDKLQSPMRLLVVLRGLKGRTDSRISNDEISATGR